MTGPLRIGVLAVFLASSPWGVPGASGQSVVPVHEEPRHRLLHDGDDLRIVDVLIQPGDTTLFHRHDVPIAYVQIDASVVDQQILGESWGDVRPSATPPRSTPGRVTWNEGYADEPVVHRVTALGPSQFRLIGILNRGPGAAEDREGPLGPFPSPEASSRWFSRLQRSLDVGGVLEWRAADRPAVMVVASAGKVAVQRAGEADRGRTSSGPGSFFVLEPGVAYRVTGDPDRPVELTFVEVR